MDKKWFVVASNASYVLPAGVCAYKMLKRNGRRMDPYEGTSLIILFLFVAFFASWSYHICRADLGVSNDTDTVNIPPCENCPTNNTMGWTQHLPGSDAAYNYQTARFIDHFMAMFTIVVVLITVVPFHDRIRKLILILTIVWMILFLSTGNESFALVPSVFLTLFLFLFWFTLRYQRENSEKLTRNRSWSLAVVFFALAITCFKISPEPYWLKHGLWHIFGAIATAFLLFKTASCYQDVNLNEIHFPSWLEYVFVKPGYCKQFD
jgi:hypothetical protein